VEDTMTKNRPHFVDSLAAASHGRFIPALGGVIIRARAGGELIGALGITGDTGENDEAGALEAGKERGLTPDLGLDNHEGRRSRDRAPRLGPEKGRATG